MFADHLGIFQRRVDAGAQLLDNERNPTCELTAKRLLYAIESQVRYASVNMYLRSLLADPPFYAF